MCNWLAVFATSLRRGLFSGLALYWSCTLEENVMEFFAVVPLNLQLYVLISPIWLELVQK